VTGTITTPDGKSISLFAYDLTQVFAYPVKGSQPDSYLAFASPGGRNLIGRNGDVRGGTAGNNIIGLDKACWLAAGTRVLLTTPAAVGGGPNPPTFGQAPGDERGTIFLNSSVRWLVTDQFPEQFGPGGS
jgi:hypothetical protein